MIKKLWFSGVSLILFFVISFIAYDSLNNKEHLAEDSASIGKTEDCLSVPAFTRYPWAHLSWLYFQLPGTTKVYLTEGNSFFLPALRALKCEPGEKAYSLNFERVKRNIHFGIANGESINQLDDRGFTITHWAILNNELELLKFLVSEGADLSVRTTSKAFVSVVEFPDMNALQFAKEVIKRFKYKPPSPEMIAYIQKH